MSIDKLAVSQKQKTQDITELQWEARIDGLKATHENLIRQKQSIEDEINRKRADFDNYVGAKDADYKKHLQEITDGRQILESQREEFKKILQQHEIDKSNHAQNVQEFQIEKNKITEARSRIDTFVISCQKAYSLIS